MKKWSDFIISLYITNAGYARKYSVFRIQDSECGFSCSFLTLRVRKGLTRPSTASIQYSVFRIQNVDFLVFY